LQVCNKNLFRTHCDGSGAGSSRTSGGLVTGQNQWGSLLRVFGSGVLLVHFLCGEIVFLRLIKLGLMNSWVWTGFCGPEEEFKDS